MGGWWNKPDGIGGPFGPIYARNAEKAVQNPVTTHPFGQIGRDGNRGDGKQVELFTRFCDGIKDFGLGPSKSR
jgi:hypothetical protein